MATEYTLSLNELLKDKLPELPGVVRSVAEREFRLAMREFFGKSYAWTTTVKDISIPTGETGIQLDDGDNNTEVIAVLGVAIGNSTEGYRPLTALNGRPIDEKTISSNPDRWYITSNPDEIVLYPYLDTATTDDLTAFVALVPAFDTTSSSNALPRQITLKYYDAIMEGFLARLYDHPSKPYSNPSMAMKKRHNFVTAIGYYASQRRGGYNGTPSWRFPRTWHVSRGGR